MIKTIRKNKLLFLVAIIYLVLFMVNVEKASLSVENSFYYVKEMLTIMPVIFLLTALIEAWVPKKMIMQHLGDESGLKGAFISILLGSVSAGPIYAAFPVCKTLLKKGASISNIVVILSAWAVIKIPMLANEAKFLSPKFMGIRWILTTISILIMGYVVSKLVKREEIPTGKESQEGKLTVNEGYCIGCGICEKLAPESFKIENKVAKVLDENIENNDIEAIKRAEEKCPAKAIILGKKKEGTKKIT